jgi:hypothetical protein
MVSMMHRGVWSRFGALLLAVASVVVLLGSFVSVQAQQADPGSAALAEMLKSLTGPGGKAGPLGAGAGSGDIDQQVRALTGSPQLTQEVYNLAAQVLGEVLQSTGGDMSKLFDLLARAQSDPSAFVATLSPETRDRLKELSDRIAAGQR